MVGECCITEDAYPEAGLPTHATYPQCGLMLFPGSTKRVIVYKLNRHRRVALYVMPVDALLLLLLLCFRSLKANRSLNQKLDC